MNISDVIGISDYNKWLTHILFEYKWFYYDYWSIVHLGAGAVAFGVVTAMNVKKRWKTTLLILAVFEVVEATIFIALLKIFQPEKIVDVFNDILVGLFGAFLVYSFFKYRFTRKYSTWFSIIFPVFFISFLWVCSYDFKYNPHFFNEFGMNKWAFIAWSFIGISTTYIYRKFRKKGVLVSFILGYAVYFVMLLLFEYITYQFTIIQEIRATTSMPFFYKILQGNKMIHLFHLIAPFFFIGLHSIVYFLTRKYEKNQAL